MMRVKSSGRPQNCPWHFEDWLDVTIPFTTPQRRIARVWALGGAEKLEHTSVHLTVLYGVTYYGFTGIKEGTLISRKMK